MTQEQIDMEIAELRERLARLEQQQASQTEQWSRIGKLSRGIGIAFALAGIVFALAGVGLTILDKPNTVFPLAMSFILTSLPLGSLAQALRSA